MTSLSLLNKGNGKVDISTVSQIFEHEICFCGLIREDLCMSCICMVQLKMISSQRFSRHERDIWCFEIVGSLFLISASFSPLMAAILPSVLIVLSVLHHLPSLSPLVHLLFILPLLPSFALLQQS